MLFVVIFHKRVINLQNLVSDVGETVKEAAGDVVESVEQKVGEIGNQLGEKVSEVTTQVKGKVTSFLPLPKKEIEDEGFPSDDVHIVEEELTSGLGQEAECSEERPKEEIEEISVKSDDVAKDTQVSEVQELKLEEISDENPKEEEESKEICQEISAPSAQDDCETVVNDESHSAVDEPQDKKEETNPAS